MRGRRRRRRRRTDTGAGERLLYPLLHVALIAGAERLVEDVRERGHGAAVGRKVRGRSAGAKAGVFRRCAREAGRDMLVNRFNMRGPATLRAEAAFLPLPVGGGGRRRALALLCHGH